MNLLAVSALHNKLFVGAQSRLRVYTLNHDGAINKQAPVSELSLLNNEVMLQMITYAMNRN